MHSRTTVIDFTMTPDEKQRLASVFLARLMEICTTEGIKFDQKVLVELVIKFFPISEGVSMKFKDTVLVVRLIVVF